MTRILESWLYHLIDEVVSQASTIKEEWDWSWRDAYLGAIDNVADDRMVHTEIPEPHSRDDVYWQLRAELEQELKEDS